MSERGLVIVVVAYGSPALTFECLSALEGAYPVVVVDNSSSPEISAIAGEVGARYIDPAANIGFAAAVNLALKEVSLSGTDVLLLNPDARIKPSSVHRLQEQLAACPQLACVSPELHGPTGVVEQSAPWSFPTPAGAWVDALGLGRLRRARDYVSGAAMLLRGEAVEQIGGFDERFFLYAEETDWQRRARTGGWSCDICNDAVAIHLGEATDSDSRRRLLRRHSGTERYIKKHHGTIGWASYRAARLTGAAARAVVRTGAKRRRALVDASIFWGGPERLALREGAVPPSQSRVPSFSAAAQLVVSAQVGSGGLPGLADQKGPPEVA